VKLQPVRTLDESWDRVVFLLVSNNRQYVRVAGFNSADFDWMGSSISKGGYNVSFLLRDRRSGVILRGTYLWRQEGSVIFEQVREKPD
jgi:hypothetical protein